MASSLLIRDTTCNASHRLAFTELLKGFICTVASNLKRQWCPTNLNEDGDGAESGQTNRHSHARILGTIAEIDLVLTLKPCLPGARQSPRTKPFHLCSMTKKQKRKRDQGPLVLYSDLGISATMLYLPLVLHPGDKVLNTWSLCEDHRP